MKVHEDVIDSDDEGKDDAVEVDDEAEGAPARKKQRKENVIRRTDWFLPTPEGLPDVKDVVTPEQEALFREVTKRKANSYRRHKNFIDARTKHEKATIAAAKAKKPLPAAFKWVVTQPALTSFAKKKLALESIDE